MPYRPPPWWRSWILVISMLLAGITVKLTVPTPNAVGGGEFSLVIIIALGVIFKVAIEFAITRWQKRRDDKRSTSEVKQLTP